MGIGAQSLEGARAFSPHRLGAIADYWSGG